MAKPSKPSKNMASGEGGGTKLVASNRRARYDYEILDTYEAGIVLEGSEVKALRAGQANLQDSYARIDGGEVWLHGMHVRPYEYAGRRAPDPDRKRKLLLRRDEIDHLVGTVAQEGLTLVPLRVYFSRGLAKVEVAVAKGKHRYDKRHAIAERDARRETDRALRRRR